MKIPRILSIVRFDFECLPKKYHSKYPFHINTRLLFLGEIPNMPEHCVVIELESGLIYTGYHTENFVEI
jgi:hypothetical protein